MKARTLSLMAGLGGSLLLGTAAQAAFTGITVEARSGVTVGSGPNDAGVEVFVCNVYANFDNPNDQVTAVAGTPDSPLNISVVGGTFWQTLGMGAGDTAPNTAFLSINADLTLDTFVTIDAKIFGSAAYGGEFPTDALGLSPGWPGFGASSLASTNAAWFITPAAAPQGLADGGQVLIGQFGTADGTGIQGNFLLQYVTGGVSNQFDGSFSHNIPAPGALALLGVAGLVGNRRRRR